MSSKREQRLTDIFYTKYLLSTARTEISVIQCRLPRFAAWEGTADCERIRKTTRSTAYLPAARSRYPARSTLQACGGRKHGLAKIVRARYIESTRTLSNEGGRPASMGARRPAGVALPPISSGKGRYLSESTPLASLMASLIPSADDLCKARQRGRFGKIAPGIFHPATASVSF